MSSATIRVVGLLVGLAACTPKAPPEASVDERPVDAVEPTTIAPVIPAAEVVANACEPCTPRTLASVPHPTRLAMDATHVFWIAEKSLLAAPRAGGGLRKLVHDVVSDALVLADAAVFTCRARSDSDRDVVRVAKTGADQSVVATVPRCELAVAGGHLYLPRREKNRMQLVRMPVAGGTVETFADTNAGLSAIVADATHLYWMDEDAIHRRALAGGATETILEGAKERLGALTLTTTHVVWVSGTDIVRTPKSGGGTPERLANLQDVLGLASDGTRVYWASVADRRWTRLDPTTGTVETYSLREGASSIAVDGTTVAFNRFDRSGRVELLDTCGCGADVLAASPAIREAEPPADEFALVLGHAESGRIEAQVSELSTDEMRDLDQVGADVPDGGIPDDELPTRFRRGTAYTATTGAGSFPASVTGFDVGSGGSGTIYSVQFAGDATLSGTVLLTREGGPPITGLRAAPGDPDAVRLVLPAMRTLAKSIGHRKAIGHKHVDAVRGRFPAPHAMLVSLVVPVSAGEDETESYVAALWLADDEGRLTSEVIGIDRGIERYDIDMLVDVGDDGVDEVLFSSSYYEGQYEHLLGWNADEPEFTTLAGDGA